MNTGAVARGCAPAWSALLENEERARAESLLAEIAGRLCAPHPTLDTSLMHGTAGVALCLGYLARAWGRAELAERAMHLLADAAERLASAARIEPGLARGAAGLGWVLEHGSRRLQWACDGDPCEALDELLTRHVDAASQSHPLDLLEGVAGIGVYFVERLPHRPLRPVLERVLLCLVEAREGKMGFGRTWWTPPLFVDEELRPLRPFGHYDLGVGRGVAGILGFVGQLARAGVGHSLAVGLVRRGADWLLSKRHADATSLPRFCGSAVPPTFGAQTWESSALSSAAVVHRALLAVGDAERAAEFAAWLRNVAAGPADTDACAGHGLGRGAAGLAHIFNRLYHATGEALFAERARDWLRHCLASLERARASWHAEAPCVNLMNGLAGDALVLLAASGTQEPAWDRCLLLSAACGPEPAGAPAAP